MNVSFVSVYQWCVSATTADEPVLIGCAGAGGGGRGARGMAARRLVLNGLTAEVGEGTGDVQEGTGGSPDSLEFYHELELYRQLLALPLTPAVASPRRARTPDPVPTRSRGLLYLSIHLHHQVRSHCSTQIPEWEGLDRSSSRGLSADWELHIVCCAGCLAMFFTVKLLAKFESNFAHELQQAQMCEPG